MNPIVKNILAVLVGIIVGGIVNSGIIAISGTLIPPPEGADLTTIEGMEAAQDLMQPIHYLMPWLAHAVGTLVGAFLAALIAGTQEMKFAIGVGVFFLLGGIAAAYLIPAPTWFIILDLTLAYIPMGIIGGTLVKKMNKE